MVLFKKMLAISLAAFMFSAPLFASADDEVRHFFYNITTDDGWAAGMALTQASVAAERGHSVTVFLNVRGVRWAEAETPQAGFSVTARSPREVLLSLIEGGHTVLVCGGCMVASGVAKDDLIEGATVTGPELTFGALTKPDTIVMSY